MATFRPLLRTVLGKAKFLTEYNINGTSSGGTLPVSGSFARSGSQKDLMKDTWSPMTIGDSGSPPSIDYNNEVPPLSSNVTKSTKLPSFIKNPWVTLKPSGG
jgi:hypothetical protein